MINLDLNQYTWEIGSSGMAMTAGIPASLNLWCVELKTGNQVSSETKCDLDLDDMISKPARELFLRVSHDELTICIIDRN